MIKYENLFLFPEFKLNEASEGKKFSSDSEWARSLERRRNIVLEKAEVALKNHDGITKSEKITIRKALRLFNFYDQDLMKLENRALAVAREFQRKVMDLTDIGLRISPTLYKSTPYERIDMDKGEKGSEKKFRQ